MHPQAQWVKRKLLRAGFGWKEISVTTTRYRTKAERAEHGDYGNAVVLFRCPLERQIVLIPAMRQQGLDVEAWTRAGEIRFVCVYDSHRDQAGTYTERPLGEDQGSRTA